jgi:hypothetical protein
MSNLDRDQVIALRWGEVFNGRRPDLLDATLHPVFRERGTSALPPVGLEVGPGLSLAFRTIAR